MIKIRKVKSTDFNEVFELYKQLYDAECPFDDNLNKKYYETEEAKNNVLNRIRSRKKIVLVAEENKKVIGIIDGYIMNCSQYVKKVGYLDHLCVDKEFRKKGIGKLLIECFEDKMKEKGAKFIKLNAFRNNISATFLYEKEGFNEYSVYYIKSIK